MDIFIEQLYAVPLTGSTYLKKAGLIILGSVLIFVLVFIALFVMPSLASIFFLLAFGVGYFTYILCGKLNVEYEYILTGGIIDIDRITNRKSRKRMLTFNCSDINGIGSAERAPQGREVKQFCAKGDGLYFSVGDRVIIFAPNERFRAEMSKVLPRHLKKELE